MRRYLSMLWTWNRVIDRVPYLLIGVGLFLVKYALDWTIATQGFGQPWSPLNYLIWPNDRVVRVFDLDDPERWFSLTMLLVSLPFIWTGVVLTLHRLNAAGLPWSLIVLFFVPLVNLLFFLVLILLPTKEIHDAVAARRQTARRLEPWQRVHWSFVRDSYWRSGLAALAITVPLSVLAVVLGAQVFQSYGFSLFVGAPFALGMISVLLFGFSRPQPIIPCLAVATAAAFLAGLALLAVALEGAICLLMASPIIFTLTLVGGWSAMRFKPGRGYSIRRRPWCWPSSWRCRR